MVSRLRECVLHRKPIPDTLIRSIEDSLVQNHEFKPYELSSLVFSLNQARNSYPENLQRIVFDFLNKYESSHFLHEMSTCDLGKFALAYGFLASKFFIHSNHLKIAKWIAKESIARNDADSHSTRNLVKCLSLCRLPIDDNIIAFFRWVKNAAHMSVDEEVFVLRAGIDYGILNEELLEKLVYLPEKSMPQGSSAASLLYSSAVAGIVLKPERIQFMLNNCKLDPTSPRSLIPLWSAHILGLDVSIGEHNYRQIIERGLNSSDPKDRTMSESIAKLATRVSLPVAQSSKHLKLRNSLIQKYGPLVSEYAMSPGLTVDEASIQQKIAIELNGPTHYLVKLETGEMILNGPTLWKERMLKLAGWKVVRVSLINREESHIH